MIEALRIEALAFGGAGVGRHDGMAVFVPYAAPGDLVRCRLTGRKKRHAHGQIEALLEGSPLRCEPACPVFGICGGCDWQHLPYGEQARWKERLLGDVLQRQAGVADPVVRPLVPSPEPYGYRSRVQFKCRQTEAGFVMGFYRRGSHYVIDVPSCPVAAGPINQALRWFRQWLPACPCPGRIPQVDLAVDDEGRLRAVLHHLGGDGTQQELATYLRPLAEAVGLSLFFQSGRKQTLTAVCGAEELFVHPLEGDDMRLGYGPGGFAQVNLVQNRRLVGEVLSAAALTGQERVLDLFCGMGNFTLPLARHAGSVLGVEDYAPSIASARLNAHRCGCSRARFLARSAEGVLAQGGDGPFSLVVMDPPRSGAYGVVKELLLARPARIIYISCDPVTLARDLKPLVHGGYRLLWSRPFDLFPQTAHVESVTLLERQP